MKRSTDRVLTTHVGSLPRPDDLMALYRTDAPEAMLQPRLRAAIGDVVQRQCETGIDVVNDGEFGKAMRSAMDFGAWWSYVYPRLAGFELREEQAKRGRAAWTYGSKERKEFAEFYAAEASAAATASQHGTSTARLYGLTCMAPVKYVGHAAIKRDIENLAAAVKAGGADEAFMTAVSPATLQILPNQTVRAQRTTPGRWPRRSATNTRRSSTPVSSCRSTIPRWSISTTGGSR
jgi:5-methyltetrahydropteroyltriglutamate--homocysteine methyltransferase